MSRQPHEGASLPTTNTSRDLELLDRAAGAPRP